MKQVIHKFTATHIEQLAANLEKLNFENIFPIQQLTLQTNTEQNLFIQSPCGSGKTLASLLPLITQNTPQVIIYVCPNQMLKVQLLQFLAQLLNNIPFFKILDEDFDILVNNFLINRQIIIGTTAQQLQLFLLKLQNNQYQMKNQQFQKNFINDQQLQLNINSKTTFIIDEADKQIRENNLLFKELFVNLNRLQNLQLNQQQQVINLNNSVYSTQLTSIQFRYFFISATLRLRESLFNNLSITPGKLIQIDEVQQQLKYIFIKQTFEDQKEANLQYFNQFFYLLKTQQIQLPAIVFFENQQQLEQITMSILKVHQQTDQFKINILVKKFQYLETDFLNVNLNLENQSDEFLEKMVIFTLDDYARGFDFAKIRSSVSIGFCEEEMAIHRLGRAGRAFKNATCFILQQQTAIINELSKIAFLQIFQSFQFFQEEVEIEKKDFQEIKDLLFNYNKWFLQNEENQQNDLQQILENLQKK